MIDLICEDIQKAINAGAYVSALALALTLPDWCGKAEYPDEGNSSRYKKWYSENIGQYETYKGYEGSYLSADVVYSLRNNLLHQGALNYDNSDVKQEQNKVNSFTLYFNENECDGGYSTRNYIFGTREVRSRSFSVNALNLIMKLRLCASAYYSENKSKFDFMDIRVLGKEMR